MKTYRAWHNLLVSVIQECERQKERDDEAMEPHYENVLRLLREAEVYVRAYWEQT